MTTSPGFALMRCDARQSAATSPVVRSAKSGSWRTNSCSDLRSAVAVVILSCSGLLEGTLGHRRSAQMLVDELHGHSALPNRRCNALGGAVSQVPGNEHAGDARLQPERLAFGKPAAEPPARVAFEIR